MKERSYFHGSYFDHSCNVVSEKDVLQTDIIGKSTLQNIRRWWNGLFLLSYGDLRSRLYYTSSNSIRVNRIKQYRYYRNRIHPLSKFRNIWDSLFIYVVTASEVILQHNTSILLGQFPLTFYYVAVVLEFFVILDLFVNFKTGYIDVENKQIILDVHRGRMHYCSTKLFLHCASAIPLQLIMFFRYGNNITCNSCKSNKFICVLKVLSLFRLKRIYEASSYWTRTRSSITMTHFFGLLRIFVVGFATMHNFLELRDVFCLWTILINGQIPEESYFLTRLAIRLSNIFAPSECTLFSLNFARVCKSYLSFNYSFSLISYYYYVDKITSLIGYAISYIFYIWSILEFYTMISRVKFPVDQVLLNKATSMNMMKSRQLPDQVSSKVMRYHDFYISKYRNTEMQNGLYTFLPSNLRTEILLSCYKRRVARVSYFYSWPPNIIVKLVLLLKVENYSQGEIVSEAWVRGDGLIIIDLGVMAVYSGQHKEIGHLIDGDYFGELSLVTDNEVQASHVVAVSSCKILRLPKDAFRKLMRRYKYLFYNLERELQAKFPSMTIRHGSAGSDVQTPEPSDMAETADR